MYMKTTGMTLQGFSKKRDVGEVSRRTPGHAVQWFQTNVNLVNKHVHVQVDAKFVDYRIGRNRLKTNSKFTNIKGAVAVVTEKQALKAVGIFSTES